MKTIRVHKAQRFTRETAPIESLTLIATDEIPDPPSDTWEFENARRFAEDARAVVEAITTTLPGGTVDQILIELLKRRAVGYVVPVVR